MSDLSSFRFPAAMIATRPGPKGTKLTYVDVRHIASVLDQIAPGWSSDVELTHNGTEYAAVCRITIDGVTRADVGSGETPPDAANQAFRRCAAAQHGLGRYLWVDTPAMQPPAPQQAPQQAPQPAREPSGRGNGNGHRRPDADADGWKDTWTTSNHYALAMDWGRKSGKFAVDQHFTNAWSKCFKEHAAHVPGNAEKFLQAWRDYVRNHEPAKVAA